MKITWYHGGVVNINAEDIYEICALHGERSGIDARVNASITMRNHKVYYVREKRDYLEKSAYEERSKPKCP